MDSIQIKSLGPIGQADVRFGDLILLIGPQASGKSIFLQLLKLVIDKKHIHRTLEQYNFVWGKNPNQVLDLFFGEGMHGIWRKSTRIIYNNQKIDENFLTQKDSYKRAQENLFYIPAQRILSISDGRPRFFTEFDESVPYVLRYFSETLRQLMQNGVSKLDIVFPQVKRLKEPLRASFNESIFHNGRIFIDEVSGQRKLKMRVDNMSIPFMTWSAGQKEFMPLLLSFYYLCVSGGTQRRDAIKYVVIEEPEMGLHPQAIKSVILQIIDLMSRGYKVVISTHSPVLLEFAWAFNLLKSSKVPDDVLFELFEIRKNGPTRRLFENIISGKSINTYFFDRIEDKVVTRDISTLDAASDDSGIAEWGGLSQFAGKVTDVVSKYLSDEE